MDIEQEAQRFDIKQGEAKKIPFFFNDGADTPVGVNVEDPVTLSFQVKKKKTDIAPLLSKDNSDMDKTDAANGNVLVPVTKDETKAFAPGYYKGEMRVQFEAANIDKSIDLDFVVHKAVHKDT